MMDWMARARAEFTNMGHLPTARTDETPLSAVSSVGVWASFENRILALDLIAAAMKVCDRHGDNEAAREEMRQQCLELPPRLKADLLDHLTGTDHSTSLYGAPDQGAAMPPDKPADPERPLP